MRYRADVVVLDSNFDPKFYNEVFDTRELAEEYRQRVLEGMQEGERSNWKRVYPVVTCSCGEEIDCTGFTNTCDNCGSDYSNNGDLLAPREQWGWETGESVQGILMVDREDY